MFRRNTLAILLACSAFAALPAFSQDEFYRQEVTGQAFGSFVSETTQDSIKQKASDSGGALTWPRAVKWKTYIGLLSDVRKAGCTST